MNRRRIICIAAAAVLGGSVCTAQLFPFQPSHDAPANITNVTAWDGYVPSPAGSAGFVRADGDRFVDAAGHEMRFFGTNLCFTGCFPQKEDADRLASELARYGINVVRLHYVHHKTPANHAYPRKDSFLEPVQLDRFDYLLAKLKEKGIYTYFQLNIARKFGEPEGFENPSRLPWYNNGLDNIDFRMIQLQKRFVKEILEHTNPYTGLQYKNEPAISMLELANENSIVYAWFTPKYNMTLLADPYGTDLRERWNAYLADKYGDTRTLRAAWCDPLKGDGSPLIPDGVFADNYAGRYWGLQQDKGGIAAWKMNEAQPKDKLCGRYYASIRIDEMGANPKLPQFFRTALKVEAMQPYHVSFKARADRDMSATVRFSQAHSPFAVAGLQSRFDLTTKWKEYGFDFVTTLDDDNVRLLFGEMSPGIIDIADITVTSGINCSWPEEQKLENDSVEWPLAKNWSQYPQRALDFTDFLRELESDYFRQMGSFVKSAVKAPQPVAGTQLQYGFDLPQSQMDYCDVHAYWCHPAFPAKSWDEKSMYLADKSLSNGDGVPAGTLMSIARSRILGRPLTISEYDHPNLNSYSAEGNLMATAFGAFQNWSAFLQFAWSHSDDYFRDVMSPQFDMCSATAKLVHLPACYALFVRQDVRRGDAECVFARPVTTEGETRSIAGSRNTRSTAMESDALMSNLPLFVATGKRVTENPKLFREEGRTVISSSEDVPQDIRDMFRNRQAVSSTGELTWNWQEKNAGYFMVDTPGTKVFSGFVHGRSFEFDGLTLVPGHTQMDWLTLSLTRATGKAVGSDDPDFAPGSYLLAATGVCRNTDQKIVDTGRGNISCGSANGGSLGRGPVLCEGIDAVMVLKGQGGRVDCYALDPSGARTARVPVEREGSDAVLHIGPQYRTVWYELIIL